MTKTLLWTAALLAVWMFASPSSGQCLTKNDSDSSAGDSAREALLKGQQEFSLDMLRTLVLGPGGSTMAPPPPPGPYPQYAKKVWFKRSDGDAPAQNVFFSPYSTYYALLMTYFGAAEGSTTANALRKALHMDDGDVKGDKLTAMQAYHLEKMFRTTVKAYSTMTPPPENATDEQKKSQGLGYELSVSNRLYFDNKEEVRPCLQKLLEAEIKKLDFENAPEPARNEINSWVEMETKGHIKDLIPQGGITHNTNLVVVNAAYFKGLWASQFSEERTVKEVFYESRSKQTLVEMMHQKGNFNHLVSERLGCQVLELPYMGETASLVILLPPFALPDGLERTIAQLNVDALREALAPGSALARPLEVAIPKFSIEQSIDLKPTLTHLGLGPIFDAEADFTDFVGEDDLNKKNMSKPTGRRPIALDAAIHRARVDIDEKGTEAAAATAIFSFRSSRPLEPTVFVANHPFAFFIYDRVAQSILFAGAYRSPRG
ncbi:serine protease inhibitor 88Ea-like [Ischnura elegans]|uniref:serine protease inhibitor 88Ea-like n=1 Tax=Ischnura elegans TaxID=197161 RepID=UPI001ED87423|nr:serine protease inhibitor 88Ea-like [Ischnura elegans]